MKRNLYSFDAHSEIRHIVFSKEYQFIDEHDIDETYDRRDKRVAINRVMS